MWNYVRINKDGSREKPASVLRNDLLQSVQLKIKAAGYSPNAISNRDLRVLDVDHDMPTISVRSGFFVITMMHVKALVLSDYVYLFHCTDNPTVESFAVALSHSIARELETSVVDEDAELGLDWRPFELVVLEAVLNSVIDAQERRFRVMTPIVSSVLKRLTDSSDPGTTLRLMLPVKNSLTTFEYSVRELRRAIDQLLSNNDDMLLLLSSQKQTNSNWAWEVELETMLEDVVHQVEELQNELKMITQRIQATQDMVSINIDSDRNRIIKLSLHMSMLTTGLGAGALFAGIFGMNLASGIEEQAGLFWPVSAGICSCAGALYTSMFMYYKYDRSKGEKVAHFSAISTLLSDLDSIELNLRVYMREHGQLSEDSFKTIVQQVTNRELSTEELQVLFRIFDMNKDGSLNYDEYLSELNKGSHESMATVDASSREPAA